MIKTEKSPKISQKTLKFATNLRRTERGISQNCFSQVGILAKTPCTPLVSIPACRYKASYAFSLKFSSSYTFFFIQSYYTFLFY